MPARIAKLPPISEKAFQWQVVKLATMMGFLVYHTYDSRRSPLGFLDLVLVRPAFAAHAKGRVIFAEVKTQKGKLTRGQCIWLDWLERAGAEVYTWRPSDLERIAEILR